MADEAGDFLKKWSGIGLLTSLFDQPEQPKVEEPKTAPLPDDISARRKRERSMQRRRAGTGRAGTMLTDNDTKLG